MKIAVFWVWKWVDFHYEGKDYSIEGESQILLSDLIRILEIRDSEGNLINVNNVAMVTFSDDHLVSVQHVSELISYNGVENVNVGSKDYLLTSLEPFTTEEKLEILLNNGQTIVVGVTDAARSNYLNEFLGSFSFDNITTDNGDGTLSVKKYKEDGEIEIADNAFDASFTNTQLTSIYARKVWKQGENELAWPTGRTVTFQLQYNDGTEEHPNWLNVEADVNGTAITDVVVENGEAISFTNLPNDKQYRVVETKVDGQPITTVVNEETVNAVIEATSGSGTSESPYVIINEIAKVTINIIKVSNETEPKRLTGASFQLKKQEMTTGEDGTISTEFVNVGDDRAVNDSGELSIADLVDGTYQLIETQAPAGYTMLSAPIQFMITAGVVTFEDTDYVTYESNTFTVKNDAGVELPSTGGIGTMLYTMSGLALMLLAGALLISRKRKYNR